MSITSGPGSQRDDGEELDDDDDDDEDFDDMRGRNVVNIITEEQNHLIRS